MRPPPERDFRDFFKSIGEMVHRRQSEPGGLYGLSRRKRVVFFGGALVLAIGTLVAVLTLTDDGSGWDGGDWAAVGIVAVIAIPVAALFILDPRHAMESLVVGKDGTDEEDASAGGGEGQGR